MLRMTDRQISSKHTPSFARGIATATVNMLLRGERNKTSDRGKHFTRRRDGKVAHGSRMLLHTVGITIHFSVVITDRYVVMQNFVKYNENKNGEH